MRRTQPAFFHDPAKAALLAPAIFVVHACEEAPGFVAWFNHLVPGGISQELFLTVNMTAFAITLLIALLTAGIGGRALLLLAVAWLSFLMFANAVFHLTGTVVHRQYAPGTVSATVLYLPYFGWFVSLIRSRCSVSAISLASITVLAGLPMYVHGYLIVFAGSRLF